MACRSCNLFGGSPEPKKRRIRAAKPTDNKADGSDAADGNNGDDAEETSDKKVVKKTSNKGKRVNGATTTTKTTTKKVAADRTTKAARVSGDSDSEQSSTGGDGRSRTRSRSGSGSSAAPTTTRPRRSSDGGAGPTTVHVTPSIVPRTLSVTPSTDGTVTTSVVTVTNTTPGALVSPRVDAAASTTTIVHPSMSTSPPPPVLTTYNSSTTMGGSPYVSPINNGMVMVSMHSPPPINYTTIDANLPTVGIYGQPIVSAVTTPLSKDGQPIRLSINVPDGPASQVRLIGANGINITRQPSQFGPPGMTRITSNPNGGAAGPPLQHMVGYNPAMVTSSIAGVAPGVPMTWESGLCDCDEFVDPAHDDEGTIFPTFCPFSILLPCCVFGQNCSMLMNENYCCRSWWACREIVKLGPMGCCMCTSGGVAALMVPLPASPFFPCLTMVQRYQIMKKYNISGGAWEVAKGFCVPCALTQHHNFLLIQRYYQRPREYPNVNVAPSAQRMI